MSVAGMLQSMSSSEVTEWMAYFSLQAPQEEKKPNTPEALKAMFAHRVKKAA
jgi:hypothetical protein